jgi:thiol-disulfide isomerase/thioredoxin
MAVIFFAGTLVLAADAPQETAVGETTSTLEKLRANPDDAKAFSAWMSETFKAISEVMESEPEDAKQMLADAKQVLEGLKPESAAGKVQLSRGKRTVAYYEELLELSKTPLAELEKQAKAQPNDLVALRKYGRKVGLEISPIARIEPAQAEAQLNQAKECLKKLKEAATEKAAQTLMDSLDKSFASIERAIEHGRELATLIGKPAPQLDAVTWANGSALNSDDLKGKVVLLDFWAIWCGPCIKTFPHLREWQEKYADKGLVIIGLTRYYNYVWNEADKRPRRGKENEDVSHEDELEMLARFAEFHRLKHRFAIQTEDHSVADDYFVKGIPQAVVIDRQGIVRLVRVGSGSKNAQALGDMIEKLVNEKPVAAK